MSKPLTIIGAMNDPALFKPWFKGPSWDNWKVFLKGLFCLPMTAKDRKTFTKFTGRKTPPKQIREAWLPVGRRGGKSLISALVAVYLACFKDYSKHLAPGEVGTVMVLAADRKQARVIMRYIEGFIDSIPMLKRLEVNRTKESIELSSRVVLEVHTTSFRTVRGYRLVAVLGDEVAFWRSDEAANPDTEILNALRPGLATTPDSLLLCLSSPYARRGELWKAYNRYYGKDGDVLVWKASSMEMNSTIPESVINRAMEEDEAAARAEWFAEFRRDIEGFVTQEAVQEVVTERAELLPIEKTRYYAFVDPSGGSQDSMTLAIAHNEKGTVILDAIREHIPPFSPKQVVKEFCGLMKSYRITQVTGDRYGGEWPREVFRDNGITYKTSDKTKSDLYVSLLPLINSQGCELLNNKRLITQLCNLERRTARSGKDSVDHGPGGRDDVANAVAGALVLAAKKKARHDPRSLSFTGDTKVPAHGNVGGAWANRPVLDPEW